MQAGYLRLLSVNKTVVAGKSTEDPETQRQVIKLDLKKILLLLCPSEVLQCSCLGYQAVTVSVFPLFILILGCLSSKKSWVDRSSIILDFSQCCDVHCEIWSSVFISFLFCA